MTDLLKLILKKFPKPISFSFAYGSSVKKQANYENKPKMIDIIFCVKNSLQWHTDNILENSHHYSSIRLLGPKCITKIQENFTAKCYFNTLIPIYLENGKNCLIKYGVISKEHLINDLQNWENFYIAGRLQKPVEILIQEDDMILKDALIKNLQNAIHTALLLLPENFNKYDLFYTIASMSYKGDFRMIFGENKRKVENIVSPQLDKFYKLYLPILQNMSFCLSSYTSSSVSENSNMKFQQDKSINITEIHLKNLPSELLRRIINNYHIKNDNIPTVINHLSKDTNYRNLISKSLMEIVRKNSILQSLKNIPTAGFKKSIQYSWEKSLKTFT